MNPPNSFRLEVSSYYSSQTALALIKKGYVITQSYQITVDKTVIIAHKKIIVKQ